MNFVFPQNWRRQKNQSGLTPLNLGLILPHSIYNEREYNKAVSATLAEMQKSKRSGFKFMEKFAFSQGQVHRIMMKVNPSPTGKTSRSVLC